MAEWLYKNSLAKQSSGKRSKFDPYLYLENIQDLREVLRPFASNIREEIIPELIRLDQGIKLSPELQARLSEPFKELSDQEKQLIISRKPQSPDGPNPVYNTDVARINMLEAESGNPDIIKNLDAMLDTLQRPPRLSRFRYYLSLAYDRYKQWMPLLGMGMLLAIATIDSDPHRLDALRITLNKLWAPFDDVGFRYFGLNAPSINRVFIAAGLLVPSFMASLRLARIYVSNRMAFYTHQVIAMLTAGITFLLLPFAGSSFGQKLGWSPLTLLWSSQSAWVSGLFALTVILSLGYVVYVIDSESNQRINLVREERPVFPRRLNPLRTLSAALVFVGLSIGLLAASTGRNYSLATKAYQQLSEKARLDQTQTALRQLSLTEILQIARGLYREGTDQAKAYAKDPKFHDVLIRFGPLSKESFQRDPTTAATVKAGALLNSLSSFTSALDQLSKNLLTRPLQLSRPNNAALEKSA